MLFSFIFVAKGTSGIEPEPPALSQVILPLNHVPIIVPNFIYPLVRVKCRSCTPPTATDERIPVQEQMGLLIYYTTISTD